MFVSENIEQLTQEKKQLGRVASMLDLPSHFHSRVFLSSAGGDSNEFLAAVCDTECIRFWKHQGMWNSLQIIFSGAHFNDLGKHKLWRSVRGAVFLALKGVNCRS